MDYSLIYAGIGGLILGFILSIILNVDLFNLTILHGCESSALTTW